MFLDSFTKTINLEDLFLVIVDTTPNSENKLIVPEEYEENLRYFVFQSNKMSNERLNYAEIMRTKILASSPFCDENTVYWNTDDDYAFNPYWYLVAKEIFTNHKEVTYISLLKEFNTKTYIPENLSGFGFIRTKSCMGGTFGVRWETFEPIVMEYFITYGINNMFDQEYWKFLSSKTNNLYNIYMLESFSLIQHCNLVSNYLNTKTNKTDHMYGLDFDPNCNPFNLIT
jgi:hypothetical protein